MLLLKLYSSIRLAFLLIVVYIFHSGCEKPKPSIDMSAHCDSIIEAPNDFLSYWFFKQGSWWIYKLDTSALIYDTVTCRDTIYNYSIKAEYNYGIQPCINNYKIFLYHGNSKYFPSYNNNGLAYETYRNTFDRGNWSLIHANNNGLWYTYGGLFTYPFMIGTTSANLNKFEGYFSLRTPVADFDSTLLISNTQTYPDEGRYFSYLYFAKNVGIAKVVYKNGETWELVDYFIKN